MPDHISLKLLFIINPGSGKDNNIDYSAVIKDYFKAKPHTADIFVLPDDYSSDGIKKKIAGSKADRVIAVGGDGTVKLVAENLLGTGIPLGILPAGSANGLARELGIDTDPVKALHIIETGEQKKISLLKINDILCIHLSDIGFNAYVVKKFELDKKRGMWTYIKAAWKVLRDYEKMEVNITTDGNEIRRDAVMVVVANATKYGTGIMINPAGDLEDDLFEVIVVRKISLTEIFKMRFTHKRFHPKRTELFQTRSLKIKSRHRVHFQVDGEYLGRIKSLSATLLPGVLQVLTPAELNTKRSNELREKHR